jgi:hypothetical protein
MLRRNFIKTALGSLALPFLPFKKSEAAGSKQTAIIYDREFKDEEVELIDGVQFTFVDCSFTNCCIWENKKTLYFKRCAFKNTYFQYDKHGIMEYIRGHHSRYKRMYRDKTIVIHRWFDYSSLLEIV